MRLLWLAAGWLFFALGLVGAVLPLMPTVVFMLLAAFCFARGSDRVHDWLLAHPRFGPPIRDWHMHRAIGRDAKRYAMVAIGLSFVLSLMLNVGWTVLVAQAVALGGVSVFILTRPDRPAA